MKIIKWVKLELLMIEVADGLKNCRLFQVSLGIYELIAGSTESGGRVLPRTTLQGFCNRPS